MTLYLNRADVQEALNIPSLPIPFRPCNPAILTTLFSQSNHPAPPAYSILPTLLSTHNISVHIYHGALDLLVNYLGVELALQNMTWNGQQGFQRRPDRTFGLQNTKMLNGTGTWPGNTTTGKAAGVWTEERGLTYHLFYEAGHAVPRDQSAEMWEYVRDVIVGAP
jgi:carboxypeptidase D